MIHIAKKGSENMKNVTYKGDKNTIEITGIIDGMPDFVKYTPRPLITFDLHSYRRKKNEEDEWNIDINRIVLFDKENFHNEFQNGQRVKVEGEVQSRNFTRDNHQIDDLIDMSVKNYIEILGSFPTKKPPKGKKREIIDWNKLLGENDFQLKLLEEIPEDSIFKENFVKDREGEFIYRVDEDRNVYKETQHVSYEILATKITPLEEQEVDPKKGDFNKAVFIGKATKQPYFDYIGSENPIAFCSMNLGAKSEFFPGRTFYINVITWGKTAEEAFAAIQRNDFVKVIGRLQSRTYEKELIKRWKAQSGKRKKKKIVLNLTTREISATKVVKAVPPKKEEPKKEENKKEENKKDE